MAIFRVMDSKNLDGQTGEARSLIPEAGQVDDPWSIRKVLELIDEAIDSAGAQLARSAGLWTDGPGPFDERDQPVLRRQSRSESARDLLEGPDGGMASAWCDRRRSP